MLFTSPLAVLATLISVASAAPVLDSRDVLNCTVVLKFDPSNYPLSSPLVQAAEILRLEQDFPSIKQPGTNGSDSQILYVPPALTTAGYAGTTDTYIWNISSTVFPSNASEVITTIWPGTALGKGSYAKQITISQTSCQ